MTTKTKDLLLFIFLVSTITVYYFFRPVGLLIVLLCLSAGLLVMWFKPKLATITWRKYAKPFLALSLVSFLVFSYFNTRLYSYDGLNNHWRMVLLVADHGQVNFPEKPYLAEFLLGIILRLSSLRVVNLTMGLWAIISAVLTFKLLQHLSKDTRVQKASWLLVILSQPFLALAFLEFKMDMILYALVTGALILFLEITENSKAKLFPFFALTLGLCVLIKSSVIPTVIMLGLLAFIYLAKTSFRKNLPLFLLGGAAFLIPILFWVLSLGITVPHFDRTLGKPNNVTYLQRNEQKLEQCINDKLARDYGSFIYGSRTQLVLLQPLFFITSYNNYGFAEIPLQSLGIFLYAGIFVFAIFGRKFGKLYWVGLGTLIPFYVFVAAPYWYLFYLFPLFALAFFTLVEQITNEKFKKVVYILVVASLVHNVTTVGYATKIAFTPIESFAEENIKKTFLKDTYEYNKILEKVAQNGKILNASEKGHQIFFLFMKDNDTHVINSNYYFGTSGKNNDEMKNELLSQGIRYITVFEGALDHEWYVGCPKENNHVLKGFLEKYTTKVETGIASDKAPSLFDLKIVESASY